jgi:hypothetical protein
MNVRPSACKHSGNIRIPIRRSNPQSAPVQLIKGIHIRAQGNKKRSQLNIPRFSSIMKGRSPLRIDRVHIRPAKEIPLGPAVTTGKHRPNIAAFPNRSFRGFRRTFAPRQQNKPKTEKNRFEKKF